ncbi:isopentenyl-diphosphate delta-isomerase idi1 [Arthrobotrys musiformis]|uniref:isopentenyl-diphosphate Delta-isomerase n=1 Tax=Arthrobotrys musiformis TaxID=47236 RepID=A0AAV9W1Y0_9PEZI
MHRVAPIRLLSQKLSSRAIHQLKPPGPNILRGPSSTRPTIRTLPLRYIQKPAAMSTTTATQTTAQTVGTVRITAENMQRLFPEINTSLRESVASSSELEGYDEEQVRLMDEVCIVLDEDDKPIGSASKKTCHLMANIDKGLLHRAFSVFLFDSEGRLLLQQRADEKITFPGLWTNTCCSHPLGIPGETGDTLEAAIVGVRRAAQRKLDQELGIPAKQVPLDDFEFLTRIHYKAPSNGIWGEHEIDYILFTQKEVDLAPNPNEVKDTKYVTADELKEMFQNPALGFTPWFKLICETMLFEWWGSLKDLSKYTNEKEIRRM